MLKIYYVFADMSYISFAINGVLGRKKIKIYFLFIHGKIQRADMSIWLVSLYPIHGE